MVASRARKLSQLMSEGGSLDTQIDSGGTTAEFGSSSTTTVSDMAALVALTGMSAGDQAYVTANNKLYFYNGSGWYLIATVQNDSPSAITGVDGAYALAMDGSPTTITAVSTDPEGFPLTWSYTTSGLGSIATITNTNNVFTITPSTDTNNAGTFTLTISATDGINGAVNTAASITLNFILTVTNSRYTTLLATATSTGDNNDIIDSSPSGVAGTHTVTVNGDAYAGTFSPYRHGGYSIYFTSNASIKFAENTIFNMGTNAFTIEMWIRPANTSSGNRRFYQNRINSMANGRGSIYQNGSNLYMSYRGDDGNDYELMGPYSVLAANTWTHVCLLRDTSDNTLKFYANASLLGSVSVPSSVGIYNSSSNTAIAKNFNGDMANIRVVNGTAITPTSNSILEKPTNVTNTVLLMTGGNLADSSGNNPQIQDIDGPPEIKTYGPIDNLEYDPTVHGGSVYFDGSGDYLSINDSNDFNFASGNGDFTIEWWMYKTNAEMGWLFSQRDGSTSELGVRIDDGNPADSYSLGYVNIQYHSDTIQFNIDTKLNTWHHCAFVRTGTTIKWYTDGVLKDSRTEPASLANYSDPLYIGTWKSQSYLYQGYISDFRITNQNAVYNGNFTPPTAPLSSPNVGVLIKGTDASIIDKSQNVNLRLYGNTTGSTEQVRTGVWANTKTIKFDGTSNTYIEVPEIYGSRWTGIWTVEFWFRTSSSIADEHIFGRAGTSGNLHVLTMNSGNNIRVAFWAGPNIDSGSLNTNTWYHVAIDFDGTTCTAFLDGSSFGTSTPTTVDMTAGDPFEIGSNIGSYDNLTGYIQDFRISLGKRRWSGSGNFPVPSGPLEG